MSAVYEARAFLHEAPYPPMTDVDHDRTEVAERFGETDVSELANYTAQSALLPDDRTPFGDGEDRDMVSPGTVENAFTTPRMLLAPTTQAPPQDLIIPDMTSHAEPIPTPTPMTAGSASPGPKASRPSGSRTQLIPKPDRTVDKHPDGKYYCTWENCAEAATGFKRRCEWSKHMDKHERPYRCEHEGCEKLSGFTYSGGLLRHEREVHNKHGGPKKTLNCPHQSCKRFTGKGFSRQENLNEHLRRVHTEGTTSSPPADDGQIHNQQNHSHLHHHLGNGDNDSERGQKRKRDALVGGEHESELLEEVKRLKQENEHLRETLHQQREMQITMVAQIADLQGALRLSDANLAARMV